MTDLDIQSATEAAAPPRPAPTFDLLPLSSELRETLKEMGYLNPTPVQLAVWEPVTRGQDAVVQARTGTGKTAAFGLPIVDNLVKRSLAAVQVLVLCPTRELALQVSAEIERLGVRKGIKPVAIYGGAPMPRQVDALAAGAQVVVGTPGRVLDHLRRKTLEPKDIRLLVLDESDEMLSMGFERELTAILDHLPKARQTLLFSATVPPDIERIARTRLKAPEFLTLSGDHIGALEIEHYVYMVAADKHGALLRVIDVENPESAIVFCNTRDETEAVAQVLNRQGFDAAWLNGDLPQSDREKVMTATREGRLRFLVATDVAARGIDISHLTHVINYDFPQDAESYVHRTGRTGRAGRTGQAISLITPRDIGGLYLLRLTYKIRPIEKQIPSQGELKTRAEADMVTMLAEAFAGKGTHPDDLSMARRLLSHDDREAIVAGLLRDHLGARPASQEQASAARRATRAPREVPRPAPAPPRPPPPPAPAAPAALVNEVAAPAAPVAAAPAAEHAPTAPHARERRPARLRGEERATREPRREPRGRGERAAADEPPRADEGRDAARAPRGAAPRAAGRPVRHADFATWEPPEEEGDDQPILGARRRDEPAAAPSGPRPARDAESDDRAAGLAEIFVNVGRRDGIRAADLARVIAERSGIDKDDVRRIRVRDKNSFVSVPVEHLARVVGALTGATIGERLVNAEQARDRGDAPQAARDEPGEG